MITCGQLSPIEACPALLLDTGACTVGVLLDGDRAWLINPGNPGIAARLKDAGVSSVDKILFTHHRRELADGLTELLEAFEPRILVPGGEVELFKNPQAYWDDPASRWRLLVGHVSYHVTHVNPIPVAEVVQNDDEMVFGPWRIRVLETPGYTDGSVTYVAENGDCVVAFTGDLIYGPGMVRDLYCHQHSDERNGHRVGDYHGFMGSMNTVMASLQKVLDVSPNLLVPAHGVVMDKPAAAVELLHSRYTTAYHNYAGISALRWYFPNYFAGQCVDERTLPMQETIPAPEYVKRLNGTTWALIASSGRAILIDPYTEASIAAAKQAIDDGAVSGYDAIWLTHFHYDHTEHASMARELFGVPVMTDSVMAETVARTEAYFLTCLCPGSCPVDCPTADGQTWRWENFTLTAYHFPGQTYYHSGLLAIPDDGPSLFFAGDAVTPTGIDDYCSWNRNWLGEGVGYDRCLLLLRELDPDIIFNQHVDVGFRFSNEACDLMLDTLAERVALFGAMVPWEHPNFATDEYWVHSYPYEQTVRPGTTASLEVRVMNHGSELAWTEVSLHIPDGWSSLPGELRIPCEAGREGAAVFQVRVPEDASGRWVIPIRVRFDDVDLGTFREAIFVIE